MFGTLGGPELFLIFVVALIVFGPRKLPDIGKSLGRMMSEFRRASNEFRSTIESEVESEKIRESMRIEPPKVEPVKARPPAEAGSGSGVAAADGGAGPAETPPGGAPGASPGEAKPEEGAAAEPDGPPSTVSRQPPAPADETK
jgi:Tat protein translocase TatB subunit